MAYINIATSMPSFKRRLTQSVLKIVELQVHQSHSPTNLMTNHMHSPLDHTPVLRLVGVLLWVPLRTRPDISWAVAKITRLATSDEARARVCIRHVAQYLRWTLHCFVL